MRRLPCPRWPRRCATQGYATGAFVAAFPLDRRFGLARGFDVYGDRMPRGPDGRLANERPARAVVDEALAWLSSARTSGKPFFLWVHLFEPHAPYGDPDRDRARPPSSATTRRSRRPIAQVGRLVAALGPAADQTLIVVASDHGEAFGEHGEIGHSLFVYDTTLRVRARSRADRACRPAASVADPVSLVDVAPTVLRLLGKPPFDADGIDLCAARSAASRSRRGRSTPSRSRRCSNSAGARCAPSATGAGRRSPHRGRSSTTWRPTAGETRDLAVSTTAPRAAGAAARAHRPVQRRRSAADRRAGSAGSDAAARLGALGYVQGGRAAGGERADPKDRRDLAARIARVTSGEAARRRRVSLLQAIVMRGPAQRPDAPATRRRAAAPLSMP